MNIGVTLPVYHANELHAGFTKQTIESLRSEKHDLHVVVVVNYSTENLYPCKENFKLHDSVKFIEFVDNTQGNHVGAAWNQGIKNLLEKSDYIIVPNNDIIFQPEAVDELVRFAEEHPEFVMWTGSEYTNLRAIKVVKAEDFDESFDEHPHFSCFMIKPGTIEKVGWFDEKLKMAYHEDGDYHYRILLSGNKAAKTNRAKFYHYGSRTIKVDDDIFATNRRTYEENRQYIHKKWNTDFHDKAYHPPEDILKEKDIFKHPFNDKNHDWRYW